MKTDFEARPVYVRREDCIQAHFLICFLSLLVYRLLEKKLGGTYTCCEILDTLRSFKFADVQGQGFMPVYEVTALTDRLHELLGFATDYEFLTKSRMKTIEKLSKQRWNQFSCQQEESLAPVNRCNKNFQPCPKREKRLYLKTKQHRCETFIE